MPINYNFDLGVILDSPTGEPVLQNLGGLCTTSYKNPQKIGHKVSGTVDTVYLNLF